MFPYTWIILALDIVPALFTIIGNSIFFVTIWKTRAIHTPSNMLLGFLSITDLLVGVLCQPLFVITILQSPVPCCTDVMVAYNFIFGVTSWNSFLFIALISADRYFAVFYPYRYRAFATCKKFTYITAIVFAVSLSYTTIDILFYERSTIAFLIFLIVFQSMVVIVTIFIYIFVYRAVLRQRRMFDRVPRLRRRKMRKRNKTDERNSKTIALILIAFIISSLPYISYHIQMLLYYTKGIKFLSSFGTWVNFLFLLNSAINPLVYFIKRSDIREAAKRILHRKFKCLGINREEIVRFNVQTAKVFTPSGSFRGCNACLSPVPNKCQESRRLSN